MPCEGSTCAGGGSISQQDVRIVTAVIILLKVPSQASLWWRHSSKLHQCVLFDNDKGVELFSLARNLPLERASRHSFRTHSGLLTSLSLRTWLNSA